jgi:hypothetical protein
VDVTRGPFRYDLVDVARQVLINLFEDVHTLQRVAYQVASVGRARGMGLAVLGGLGETADC